MVDWGVIDIFFGWVFIVYILFCFVGIFENFVFGKRIIIFYFQNNDFKCGFLYISGIISKLVI